MSIFLPAPRSWLVALWLVALWLSLSGCDPVVDAESSTGADSTGSDSSGSDSSGSDSSGSDSSGSDSTGSDRESAASIETEPAKLRPPVLVETAPISRDRIVATLTLGGDLQAEHRVSLTSQVAGVVKALVRREGETVSAGEVILLLDDREFLFAAKEKELAHQNAIDQGASATLALAEARTNTQLKDLAKQKAHREYERLQALVSDSKPDPFSEEEVEAKRFAYEEAKLSHQAAVLAAQRAEIQERLDTIAIGRAKIGWERANLDLERATIRSPIDGAISFLEVKPGELVPTGTPVATVVSPDQLFTDVRVPQRRLPMIEVGQAVEVVAETYPDVVFDGRVEVIHPTVDPEQGTVKVRIAVLDPRGMLRPGNFASATIVLAVHADARLLPKRSRLVEAQGSYVFVARAGLAVRVPVTLGLSNRDSFEILPGALQDDDLVIVRGQTHLRDGDPIELVSPPSTSPEETVPPEEEGPASAPATTGRD